MESDTLARRSEVALAKLTARIRARAYGTAARALLRLTLPSLDFRGLLGDHRAAQKLHEDILSRPGMRQVLRRLELQDLLSLPLFAATLPLDVLRAYRKQRHRISRLDVVAADDFPYPDYYLNDFHHQANGNLSLRAALTYEWQIRFLFHGANRLMRQAVVDALPEGSHLEVLDVGCGTAAWIAQARLQRRGHWVTGVDLSPPYLRVARLLNGRTTTFLQANAEQLSQDWAERFDVVTCIWLFHELPVAAAERVMAEIARVLKPGGRLIFLDALQEAPDPQTTMDGAQFAEHFNEPYFEDYQRLDLAALTQRHGLRVDATERWYVSKLLTATKP